MSRDNAGGSLPRDLKFQTSCRVCPSKVIEKLWLDSGASAPTPAQLEVRPETADTLAALAEAGGVSADNLLG
jgi:hypothetical protein